MKRNGWILFCVFLLTIMSVNTSGQTINSILPGGSSQWNLSYDDEFDYPDAQLDVNWYSANGAQSGILCSRWRVNAVVSNGTLKLINRKETKAGQNWTSASIWTKKQFKYGYFECRYKYAAATGTNNSFWLMTPYGATPTAGKKFEIDINEGHYPSEMATNVHNWTDVTINPITGVSSHPTSPMAFNLSPAKPDINIQLETPITTSRIRFSSTYAAHFHIQEFRIYNVNDAGYPSVLSPSADQDVVGLVNYSRDPLTIITSSGVYGTDYEAQNVADGTLVKHWVSQANGEKWLEFEFSSDKTIGCIQFVNGWLSNTTWNAVINNYKVQYYDGTAWVDISDDGMDLSKEFHIYGLEWRTDSLIYYFDGKAMRKMKNDFCYSASPVFLSEAILTWAGEVTDAIDGTQMEIDYFRYFDRLTAPVEQVNESVPAEVYIKGNTLVVNSETNLKLELFSLNGSLVTVVQMPVGNYSMPIDRKGFYLVRLSNNKAVMYRKIVVGYGY